MDADRQGAKQPTRFDPARAARLDDPERFDYLPPAAVLELLDIADGACAIDFGAGTGTYAIALARLRPGARVVAYDEQPEMLALLRKKLETHPVSNVEPLGPEGISLLRGRADRILAINVLHELGDAGLVELRTLLNHAGSAVFIDWSADAERPVGPPREHVYTMGEARARLENLGFRVVGSRQFLYQYGLVAKPIEGRG